MIEIAWEDFGRLLSLMRRRKGLSQERLARLVGCTREHIWRLEHHQRRPSRMFLVALVREGIAIGQDADIIEIFILLRMSNIDANKVAPKRETHDPLEHAHINKICER